MATWPGPGAAPHRKGLGVVGHESAGTPSFIERHHFLIRRLHSLSGLVPIGVFVVLHLSVNASINAGGAEFQKQVDKIHALGPLLVPAEILGIFLPLLFHALLGFQIWFTGLPNVGAYKYGANYRYTLQRVTGGIAFFYMMYHVWHMHWLGRPLGGGAFDPEQAASTAAAAMRHVVFGVPVSVLYVIGVLATVFHLANGIWTSLITWGVTISPSSQRAAGYVCAVFGVALGLAGLSAVRGFSAFEAGAAAVQARDHDRPATIERAGRSG